MNDCIFVIVSFTCIRCLCGILKKFILNIINFYNISLTFLHSKKKISPKYCNKKIISQLITLTEFNITSNKIHL